MSLVSAVGRRLWFGTVRATLALPPGVLRRLARGTPPAPDGLELDPTMALVLAAQRAEGQRRLAQPRDVDAARRRMRRNTVGLQGRPTRVRSVRDLAIEGPGGPLRLRHYAPDDPGGPHPLLVYFHGGGFALGDLDTHDEPCRMIAHHAGVHVLAVDYRLAPEHPFPAGLDDAQTAYAWALAHAAELGADPGRVAVGGDSAGANLGTVVSQLCASEGLPRPHAQLLVYPPTDHWGDYRSRHDFAEGFLLTADDIDWFHDTYSGPGRRQGDDPRRSPLKAEDLSGQPPALVVTAAFDPLRDEGEAYADRLRAAGVDVIVRRVPGLLHGFLSMTSISRPARAVVIELCALLRPMLARPGGPR